MIPLADNMRPKARTLHPILSLFLTSVIGLRYEDDIGGAESENVESCGVFSFDVCVLWSLNSCPIGCPSSEIQLIT